jgi:proton-translocating NADH-quinone oxidoreductase chain L
MYLCILGLPLMGFIGAAGFGRFLGGRGAGVLTTSLLGLCFLFSCLCFYEVGICGSPCTLKVSPWFLSESWDATWGLLFDPLTGVMCVVVTSVSTLVHLYSTSYMGEDPHLPRFMSYLSLFTFFMLILITGDNFLQMFVGWEGVGLASYLLINFWFTRLQANKSAIKAMLMNRVGDLGLGLGIFALYTVFQSVNFETVFACAPHLSEERLFFFGYDVHAYTLIGILLFIGATGKSAQLGLHTWLPDAMEGPTPVSALIHAATMVTAGVFLIARCSPIYEYAPDALGLIAFAGGMTAFFAATTGLVQNDLKRVIAYSTCSQLGYMVFACGLSHYDLGVFHLANHAFFKALLFLGAGSVIHAMAGEQDMRRLGGLSQALPFTYTMMFLGSLALVGFPFLSGFYSKDALLEVACAHYTLSGDFTYILGCGAAFCTSYYSFRLVSLIFMGEPKAPRKTYEGIHDAPFPMAFPLILLGFGSLFTGFLGKDLFVGLGTPFWGNALGGSASHTTSLEAEYISQEMKHLPFVLTVIGASLGLCLNSPLLSPQVYKMKLSSFFRSIYIFLNRRWLFDKVYIDWIGRPSLTFGYQVSFKSIDKGVLEILGPFGITESIRRLLVHVREIQSGLIYHYAFMILLGLTFLLTFLSLDLLIGLWVDIHLWCLCAIGFLGFLQGQDFKKS